MSLATVLAIVQVHKASSAESLRLLGQVDNANTELRWTTESLLLGQTAHLQCRAQLERRRADIHREEPSLQEMSFRQLSTQERRLSPHGDPS